MTTRDSGTYLLPLKSSDDRSGGELTRYLEWLSERVDVVVIDGSNTDVFERHHDAWAHLTRHESPKPEFRCANGKVHGVLSGLASVSTEKVVIADDDVRYDEESLSRTLALLDGCDLVRPQNFFRPLPWHAKWDTARSLLNRAFGADYPGTLAVRTSLLRRTNGYDGDVLFENLELMRTIEAVGGRSCAPLDLFVLRLPPDTAHFVSQRVRQAYDEFALPLRLATFLCVLPFVGRSLVRRRFGALLAAGAVSVGLAEVGRRKDGGAAVFPISTSFFAPAWILERGVCMWAALWWRIVRGGVRYGESLIATAANPLSRLRRRFSDAAPAEGSEP